MTIAALILALMSNAAFANPPQPSEPSIFEMSRPHLRKFAVQVQAENGMTDELKTTAASPVKPKKSVRKSVKQ